MSVEQSDDEDEDIDSEELTEEALFRLFEKLKTQNQTIGFLPTHVKFII